MPNTGTTIEDLTNQETSLNSGDLFYMARDDGGGNYTGVKVDYDDMPGGTNSRASTSDVNTGTSTTKFITPEALDGSAPAFNSLTFNGATSGTILLQPEAIAGSNTITIPADTGTIVLDSGISNTITDTTGTIYGFQVSSTITPSASSDAIITALNGTIIISHSQTITGSGHFVGLLGTCLSNTTTTVPLMVGTEGLVQKITTGTVDESVGLLSHNLGNAGVQTLAHGVRCAITGNTNQITTYNALQGDIVSNSGTITNWNCVLVKNLNNSSTLSNVRGLKFENQTATIGSKKAIEILDSNAPIDTIGDITGPTFTFKGSSSGTTVLQPEATASGTLTLPATTGTLMVTGIEQVAESRTGTSNSGTATTPLDNSIPQQSTEGKQYLSVSITPTSTTTKLLIEWGVWIAFDGADWGILALHQDSIENSLCSLPQYHLAANVGVYYTGSHYMTSGTTSSTTFKIFVGKNSSGTTYFNKISSSDLMNGTIPSFIRVTEIKV